MRSRDAELQARRDRRTQWRTYRSRNMAPRSPLIDNRAKRPEKKKPLKKRTFEKHVPNAARPASTTSEDEDADEECEESGSEASGCDASGSEAFGCDASGCDASQSDASLFLTVGGKTARRLRLFRSTKPRKRVTTREKRVVRADLQQTTRNVRSLETDAIAAVHVDEYDYSRRLYTVRLTMVHEDGVHRCRVKLSWTQHVQRSLSKVKRKTPKSAFNRFMQDVNRMFSFAPKYKSFKQFLAGRMNSRNHRSVLLVGTVLTYIVEQAKQKENANYRVCILLLEKIFGIMN